MLKLLQCKSECLHVSKIFYTWIQSQIGYIIKTLHFNQGREYLSSEFTQYLETYGIQYQFTIANIPCYRIKCVLA